MMISARSLKISIIRYTSNPIVQNHKIHMNKSRNKLKKIVLNNTRRGDNVTTRIRMIRYNVKDHWESVEESNL